MISKYSSTIAPRSHGWLVAALLLVLAPPDRTALGACPSTTTGMKCGPDSPSVTCTSTYKEQCPNSAAYKSCMSNADQELKQLNELIKVYKLSKVPDPEKQLVARLDQKKASTLKDQSAFQSQNSALNEKLTARKTDLAVAKAKSGAAADELTAAEEEVAATTRGQAIVERVAGQVIVEREVVSSLISAYDTHALDVPFVLMELQESEQALRGVCSSIDQRLVEANQVFASSGTSTLPAAARQVLVASGEAAELASPVCLALLSAAAHRVQSASAGSLPPVSEWRDDLPALQSLAFKPNTPANEPFALNDLLLREIAAGRLSLEEDLGVRSKVREKAIKKKTAADSAVETMSSKVTSLTVLIKTNANEIQKLDLQLRQLDEDIARGKRAKAIREGASACVATYCSCVLQKTVCDECVTLQDNPNQQP